MLDWRLIDAMIYSSSSLECPALDNLFARNHIMIALSKADIESFAMQAVCVSNLYGAIDLYSEHYLRNLIVQLIHPRPVPKASQSPRILCSPLSVHGYALALSAFSVPWMMKASPAS